MHLKYEASDKDMEGYSDADWAADSDDRRPSESGNLFVMSNGAISWASQKQPTVAISTPEAECIALSLVTQAVAEILVGPNGKLPNFRKF